MTLISGSSTDELDSLDWKLNMRNHSKEIHAKEQKKIRLNFERDMITQTDMRIFCLKITHVSEILNQKQTKNDYSVKQLSLSNERSLIIDRRSGITPRITAKISR